MEPILFYSTNDPERRAAGIDFADALMKGLAPDKGLYLMDKEALPQLSPETIASFATLPYDELAWRVLTPFVRGRVPE